MRSFVPRPKKKRPCGRLILEQVVGRPVGLGCGRQSQQCSSLTKVPGATRAVVCAMCSGGWLPALVPRDCGPGTLMEVVEDHLREHFRDGDRPGKKAAGEDEAQNEPNV